MNMEQKRVVLITGAGGGIGYASLFHFASRGWRVIGVDRRGIDGPVPEGGAFIQADISQEESVRSIDEQVHAFSPTLDAVVNNAAIQIAKPMMETTAEEWDLVIASNLRSVFLVTRLAHPLLIASGGGAIVNVSSVHAVATSSNVASYAASKGGLLALTRAMAIEFAGENIRVNAILPGATDTPMLRVRMTGISGGTIQDRMDTLARKTVIGRVARPEEIASAIYFMADNQQSSFITGQALVVDGGATARLSTE